MALTLKFRPKSFAEVVGQDAVVGILSTQIAKKKFKNAYLFAGAHGCGKTSTARIFANEVNHGEGEPIEIDAASHNGVDDVRAIITDAQQPSIDCDYKVYIIDEVQNFSKSAWDCALKLIEEPPKHAIFIFCTTAPSKIPMTILSRVQRFDFYKVPSNIIADRLEFILNEECNATYERYALEMVANLADGHIRDAVQYLEKCLDATSEITSANVETILGLVDSSSLISLEKCALNKDLKGAISELDNVNKRSFDLLKFFDSLLEFAIDCSICAKTGENVNTAVPSDIVNELSDKKDLAVQFMERLVVFRRHCDNGSVIPLLKALFVEVCK